jgi:diguanylate cyclase (GGDEF)-like protein
MAEILMAPATGHPDPSSGEVAPRGRSTGWNPTEMNPLPNILVCDHRGEGFAAKVGALEKQGYGITVSTSLRGTLERLGHSRPEVILIDPLIRGGSTELAAIETARTGRPPVPVLVVADQKNPLPTVLATRALTEGLWDMIHREAPAEEYAMRLDRLREQARRLAEMEDLRHRAVHDDHTDLLRKASFHERLRQHFSAAYRHKLDMALLLLDLDRFGQVNKLHDHVVGDRLIQMVGEAIRRTLRAEDVAGRLGGDEFAVLLPYTRKVDAASVVQRLLDEIRNLTGQIPGAREAIDVSVSIGFETFDGNDVESVEELRAHTERALREAKQRGGNQGVYYRSIRGNRREADSASADQ